MQVDLIPQVFQSRYVAVRSESDRNKLYRVWMGDRTSPMHCTCEDFRLGPRQPFVAYACKHIKRVLDFLGACRGCRHGYNQHRHNPPVGTAACSGRNWSSTTLYCGCGGFEAVVFEDGADIIEAACGVRA